MDLITYSVARSTAYSTLNPCAKFTAIADDNVQPVPWVLLEFTFYDLKRRFLQKI
jgi:hypothetical protein